MIRSLGAAVAALILSQPAPAPLAVSADPALRRWGDAIFVPPAGWEWVREDGVLNLSADLPEGDCDYCRIWLVSPLPPARDLTTLLSAQATRFVEAEDLSRREVIQPPQVDPSGRRPIAAMSQRIGDSALQVLIATGTPQASTLLVLHLPVLDEDELEANLGHLGRTLFPLATDLEFLSEGAAPIVPPPEPGGLSGIWWGMALVGPVLQLDMSWRYDLGMRVLMFWPDGQVRAGLPETGTRPLPAGLPFDPDLGIYRETATGVEILWSDGRSETLSREGTRLSDGTFTLEPTLPLPDGTALDGAHADSRSTGFGPGVTGMVTSHESTRYFPDGTYVSDRIAGATMQMEIGGDTAGVSTGSESEVRGRYRIEAGQIILTPEDGGAVTRLPALQTPDGVLIGENFLE